MALGNLRVERAGPLGNDHRRDAVADGVARGDRHWMHTMNGRPPFRPDLIATFSSGVTR
jgi:hypothetical protein